MQICILLGGDGDIRGETIVHYSTDTYCWRRRGKAILKGNYFQVSFASLIHTHQHSLFLHLHFQADKPIRISPKQSLRILQLHRQRPP